MQAFGIAGSFNSEGVDDCTSMWLSHFLFDISYAQIALMYVLIIREVIGGTL